MNSFDEHFNDPSYKKVNWSSPRKTQSDEWIKFYKMMVKLSKQLERFNRPTRVKVKRKR